MFDKNFIQVLSLHLEQLRRGKGYPRNVGSRSPYDAVREYEGLLLKTLGHSWPLRTRRRFASISEHVEKHRPGNWFHRPKTRYVSPDGWQEFKGKRPSSVENVCGPT